MLISGEIQKANKYSIHTQCFSNVNSAAFFDVIMTQVQPHDTNITLINTERKNSDPRDTCVISNIKHYKQKPLKYMCIVYICFYLFTEFQIVFSIQTQLINKERHNFHMHTLMPVAICFASSSPSPIPLSETQIAFNITTDSHKVIWKQR